MNVASFVFNVLSGNSGGISGKINQYRKIGTNSPPPRDTAEIDLEGVKAVGPIFRGSVAWIYRGEIEGTSVCLKVINKSAQTQIEKENRGLSSMAWMASVVNQSVGDALQRMTSRFEQELDLVRELRMAKLVASCIGTFCNVSVPHFLESYCSQNKLVYRHADGTSLDRMPRREVTAEALTDIVRTYFYLLQVHGVILGDTNPGNFVYNPRTQHVTLIDFGAVETVGVELLGILHSVHRSHGDLEKLRDLFPDHRVLPEVMAKQGLEFWADSQRVIDFKISEISMSVVGERLPTDFEVVCRSGSQLLGMLTHYAVPLNLRPEMEKIEAMILKT